MEVISPANKLDADEGRPLSRNVVLSISELTSTHAPTPSPTLGTTNATEEQQRRAILSSGDDWRVVIVCSGSSTSIAPFVADVLGRPWRLVASLAEVKEQEFSVVGIHAECMPQGRRIKEKGDNRLIVNVHSVDSGTMPDPALTHACDYEFLYIHSPFLRRDLARFFAHILGQSDFHEQLIRKQKSYFISTTFPDVRTALSNLDILTVGADAVELRVDLLKEPHTDGTFSAIPSLQYVGEQVMLLRQRTELPLIFTTRCTKENGKFPMDDPTLFYDYLSHAIKWGVEYIDVELWLPEEIRQKLSEQKGSSRIISAFHDFSGNFKWTTEEAERIFQRSSKYSDICKMIVMIRSLSENYDLEYFRSKIQSKYSGPPLSAVNMGSMGQLSRALNTVFSPITHPLLPIIAAPGQMSAAEINGALHVMGQLPKRELYAIGTFRSSPQSVFFEKCFNELGLPHHFSSVFQGPKVTAEAFVTQPNFGGAYINPPLKCAVARSYIPSFTEAAQCIGHIDTIISRMEGDQCVLAGDNATWKGIRATLIRDFVPSAYHGRAALVLSSSEADAAPAIYALRSLHIRAIFTVGFKASGPLATGLEPFTSVDSVKRVEQPFVIISALPPEKSLLVQPLLRHYSIGHNGNVSSNNGGGKVFVDLANGPRKGDPMLVAANMGWMAYGIADVSAWATVETLRLLVGQNVPFDFVRMASGRGLY